MKIKLSKSAGKLWSNTVKNGPTVLTGFGVVGFVSTVIFVGKAAPKAEKLLLEKKKEVAERINSEDYNGPDRPEILPEDVKLPVVEIVRTVGPIYAPAAVLGASSIACFIGANSINLKRNMALASAYSLSEQTLKTYREKVIDRLGEKKEADIHREIAEERIKNDKPTQQTIVVTGHGNYLCYEPMSKSYFESDIEKIRQAKNNFNEAILNEMYMSLNEWLDLLGLKSVPWGDYIGWNVNEDGLMDFTFDYASNEEGRPCASIRYLVGPRDNYKDVY